MDAVEHSTLYAAATESLVSDASATSTFEKMITVAYTHSTVDTFVKEVKETEACIKKDFDISFMPGPWRSAKSVVIGAMKLNIPLIDTNGQYCGKTNLQMKIKELKSSPEVVMDSDFYSTKIIQALNKVPDEVKAGVYQAVRFHVGG